MANTSTTEEGVIDDGPLLPQRRMPDDAGIDMTPMIDCVFLLNIFFILTFVSDPSSTVSLPPSTSGAAINPQQAVTVTIAAGPEGTPLVYLGDGKRGSALSDDPTSQREALLQYLQAGASEGKIYYQIKSDRGLKAGDVTRIVSVVSEVEGLIPHFAVLETQD
jgi:biopolymer transport protein ExbD